LKKVLDVCCGPKGMWFDKKDSRALFMDKRKEIHNNIYPSLKSTLVIDPDIVGDFTNMKFDNNSFWHIVFDPPHIKRNKLGEITKRYGNLEADWKKTISKGFKECFRVLKPNGTLIFKWSEVQFSVKEVLKLTDQNPLYGHRSGKRMNTHWIAFIKE
jgi:23S rRNA G2069 N7-methylase RlmK/C1962 C5-methylase RlmI